MFLISLVLVTTSRVYATEKTSSNSAGRLKYTTATNIKERIQTAHKKNLEIRENIKNRASDAAQRKKEKLSDARIKICQARQKGISQRAKYMLERGKGINKGHEKIYMRVDKFYNEKLVSAGYTLSNYSDLTAEIEANKQNVLALLESAKATGSAEFNCNSDDPLGQISAFKEDMRALIEANKAYKESIHDFVKAVRDLAKTARLEKISPSSSPSVTPVVE